jgi:hypothetical protein
VGSRSLQASGLSRDDPKASKAEQIIIQVKNPWAGGCGLAVSMQSKNAPLNRRDAIEAEAKPQPNRAKRLECAELAPAFGRVAPFESASKLVELQTLRVAVHPGNQFGRRLKLRQRHG